jgi:hypothetical protein
MTVVWVVVAAAFREIAITYILLLIGVSLISIAGLLAAFVKAPAVERS